MVSNEFLRVCKFTHISELQDFFISNFSSKIVQVKNSFICYKLFHVAKAKIISWQCQKPKTENEKRLVSGFVQQFALFSAARSSLSLKLRHGALE